MDDPTVQLTDADLVQAFRQQRSKAALSRLVERHGPAVYASARRQLADASLADDVTQAVFLVLIRRAGSIRRPERVGGWLIKVTRHCVLNARRGQQRRTVHEQRAAMNKSEALPSVAAAPDVLPQLDAAIARLGDLDRAVVTLTYLHGRPVETVARELKMNVPAVRKRMARAVVKLRAKLAAAGVVTSADALAAALARTATPREPAFDPATITPQGTVAAAQIARATVRQLSATGLKWAAAAAGVVAVSALGVGTTLWATRPPPAAPAHASVPPPPALGPGRVYASDFAAGTAGWSAVGVDRTPKDQTPFLGPLGNNRATLRVANLAKHDFVRVHADLYVMKTWDGVTRLAATNSINGPDFWAMGIAGRPTLVRATFSATPNDQGFALCGRLQTYPAVVPGLPDPAGTGAYAVNGLGYAYDFKAARLSFPMDGAYHIDFTLPHTQDTLELWAQGFGLEAINSECWGLADVHVDTLTAAEVSAPSDAAMQADFTVAASTDDVRAREAFFRLAAGGDATVAFLQRQTEPPGFNTAGAAARIADLKSRDPATVFAAEYDLAAMGPAVETMLAASARDGADDPTVRGVLERIALRPIEEPSARAAAAKARLLMAIDTPAARSVLSAWLADAPAWRPDWLRRFEDIYRLPDDSALVYVASPDRAVRSRYLARRQELIEHSRPQEDAAFYEAPPDSPDVTFVIDPADPTPNLYSALRSVDWPSPSSPAGSSAVLFRQTPVQKLLVALSRASKNQKAWMRLRVAPELRNVVLPGDWVVRHDPPQDRMVAVLARVLGERVGRRVSVTTGETEDLATTLAAGPATPGQPAPASATRSAPTDDANLGAADRPTVDVYVDPADREIVGLPSREMSVAALAQYLTLQLHRTVQIRTDTPARVDVVWHPGALQPIDPDDATTPETRRRVDTILQNVADQLGLTATHSSRTVPVMDLSVDPQ